MIVLDSSVAVALVTGSAEARAAVRGHRLYAPHLIDAEVGHAIRGLNLGGQLDDSEAAEALARWVNVDVTRLAMAPLLAEAFGLRHNLTVYDALFVVTAGRLGCPLVTADRRLAATPTPVAVTILGTGRRHP